MKDKIIDNQCPICGKKLCRRHYVYIHLRQVHHLDPTPYYVPRYLENLRRTPLEKIKYRKEYMKEWGQQAYLKKKDNPEYKRKRNEYTKQHNQIPRVKAAHKISYRKWQLSPKGRAWAKQARGKYREQRNVRRRQRWHQDSQYRLNSIMGASIYSALREKKDKRQWETLLPYTLDELIKHLENLFDEKMSWDNYGSYWVVDHKKPKSWFHYVAPEETEFQQCWALSNLQPLEKQENMNKSNKYESI